MSDYMFMLENHLTAAQNRVVAEMRKAAAEARVNLFLTGGAVRDMLGGFPIRDLDFTIEGAAGKIPAAVADALGAEIISTDSIRKSVELMSAERVTFEISMARSERYAKTGAKPVVTPSTIHDDLRRRDFTINALALSLNRASRGLLLDPTNGMGDLDRREIRSTGSYVFYDSPARLLRLGRFRTRLGFSIAERTESQYRQARGSETENHIRPEELLHELRQASLEPNLPEWLEWLQSEKLLPLISPALDSSTLNLQTFTKLQKLRQSFPFGIDLVTDEPALFFALLTEKLSAKERAAVAALDPEQSPNWLKLGARSAKLEKEIGVPTLHRPSRIHRLLSKTPGEQMLYLYLHSHHRSVQDRIRNYLQKYISTAQEVTDEQVVEAGFVKGTAKFEKAKSEMIAKHLDARPPKKAAEEAAAEPEMA